MTTVSSNVSSTDRFSIKNAAIATAGSAIGWESIPYIKKTINYPFGKYLNSKIKTIQGGNFEIFINNALKQNNLQNNLTIKDLNLNNATQVIKELGLKLENPKGLEKLLFRILHIPQSNKSSVIRTIAGQNAFFYKHKNAIVCNFEKFSAPVFHEIAHKLNSQSKNLLIKTLSKIKTPLAICGPIYVGITAIFRDPNKKDSNRPYDKVHSFIKDNCGFVAAATVLPLTIEECIANIKGTKIAQKAGVSGELLKKVKSCNKLSILSYCVGLLTTGVSIYCASKIRDFIYSMKPQTK